MAQSTGPVAYKILNSRNINEVKNVQREKIIK